MSLSLAGLGQAIHSVTFYAPQDLCKHPWPVQEDKFLPSIPQDGRPKYFQAELNVLARVKLDQFITPGVEQQECTAEPDSQREKLQSSV